MALKFNIPVGIDPSQVNVTLKDRDLILRCEDKKAKDDSVTKFHYYQVRIRLKNPFLILFKLIFHNYQKQRTTLPENTNLNALKCVSENNQISITAPLEKVKHKSRVVPIENP